MKNKKFGFTLIELLAVIIILAIVALIATPIILNVIEDARISAGRSEANMILGGINNYCASEDMKYQLDNNYERICTSSMDVEDVKEMVNLGNATIDKIIYDGKKLIELEITSNNHKFTLCPSGTFAMDNEECDGGEVGVITTGPIKDVVLSNFPELEINGNGCITSTENNYSYMGGCYIKGNPNNNYIWYSGFLWRIMGINADESVRLITDENVTVIPFGENSVDENWDGSYAKDWLNNYFYSRLKGNNIIKESTWCSETTTSSSSARTECKTNLSKQPAYVGLVTLDEYNLAGSTNSYLNIGQAQITITPYDYYIAYGIGNLGSIGTDDYARSYGVRAVINVNPDAIITSGNGNISSNWSNEFGPYILNEDKNAELTGKLNEKATSGEYVLFAGKKYRLVDKDSDGNTKLILDGYYDNNSTYGNNSTFTINSGIGQKLNTDVLEWLIASGDIENRNKLVIDYKWYQNNFNYGDNYTASLNEENSTTSISATVGLIRIGEMMSGQSSSILTKGYAGASGSKIANTYWTLNQFSSNNNWCINFDGTSSYTESFLGASVRPVIVVNSDVTIIGGNGTWSNPYQI